MPSPNNNNNQDDDEEQPKRRQAANDDDDDGEPVTKRPRITNDSRSKPKPQRQQATLTSFFQSKKPPKPKQPPQQQQDAKSSSTSTKSESTTTPSIPPDEPESKPGNNNKKESTQPPPIISSMTTTTSDTTAPLLSSSLSFSNSPLVPPPLVTPVPDPIVPTIVSPNPRVEWKSLHDSHVLVRIDRSSTSSTTSGGNKNKLAALDLDGTLVIWASSFSGFWPNQLTHFNLWSSTVIPQLRALVDDHGYQLLIVSNQGGIQSAHSGKKATLVKHVINYLAHELQRPLQAVVSTKSPKRYAATSFHKPSPKLWKVALESSGLIQPTNKKEQKWNWAESFFAGDSADPNDDQGGVDAKFAQAVSDEYLSKEGVTLQFFTPTQLFGPSDEERRSPTLTGLTSVDPVPPAACQTRAALLGGYLSGPLLLLLCGVQGSGKSTVCHELIEATKQNPKHLTQWVHLSQDTINNGKPGKRETVEARTRHALEQGLCVVVDRMHLDATQRQYFVAVAESLDIPVHVLALTPPQSVVVHRVRHRTNHPGKVQGPSGVKSTLQSLRHLVLPTYAQEPGLTLIHVASTPRQVSQLVDVYRNVRALSSSDTPNTNNPNFGSNNTNRRTLATRIPLASTEAGDDDHDKNNHNDDDDKNEQTLTLPILTLGTMGIGKKKTADAIREAIAAECQAIDTAPTYKNEEQVGEALSQLDPTHENVFCIAKIPKSVTQPEQVAVELDATLTKLQRSSVHLLLLHWPCDVMAADTLSAVWKAMEACVQQGKCRALGVCNFNGAALTTLLASCTIRPVVNQVERHPLLPQWDLMDVCARHNIVLQAHTPLGQGRDELLAHPVIVDLATQHGSNNGNPLSPAQVVLLWNLQQGCAVVPKCSSPQHLRELTRVIYGNDKQQKEFVGCLSPAEMKRLDSLTMTTASDSDATLASTTTTRFVAPPFMYGTQSYCWGTRMPRRRSK